MRRLRGGAARVASRDFTEIHETSALKKKPSRGRSRHNTTTDRIGGVSRVAPSRRSRCIVTRSSPAQAATASRAGDDDAVRDLSNLHELGSRLNQVHQITTAAMATAAAKLVASLS